MREVGAFAAKTHLSHLLECVNQGESIAITKHGRVIAFLTPPKAKPKLDVEDAIAGITALRQKIRRRGIKATSAEIQVMKETGRK